MLSDRGFTFKITSTAGGMETSELEKAFDYMGIVNTKAFKKVCFLGNGPVNLRSKKKKNAPIGMQYTYMFILRLQLFGICEL